MPSAANDSREGPASSNNFKDSKSAEHKKSFSAAIWIFCMEPNSFGV